MTVEDTVESMLKDYCRLIEEIDQLNEQLKQFNKVVRENSNVDAQLELRSSSGELHALDVERQKQIERLQAELDKRNEKIEELLIKLEDLSDEFNKPCANKNDSNDNSNTPDALEELLNTIKDSEAKSDTDIGENSYDVDDMVDMDIENSPGICVEPQKLRVTIEDPEAKRIAIKENLDDKNDMDEEDSPEMFEAWQRSLGTIEDYATTSDVEENSDKEDEMDTLVSLGPIDESQEPIETIEHPDGHIKGKLEMQDEIVAQDPQGATDESGIQTETQTECQTESPPELSEPKATETETASEPESECEGKLANSPKMCGEQFAALMDEYKKLKQSVIVCQKELCQYEFEDHDHITKKIKREKTE